MVVKDDEELAYFVKQREFEKTFGHRKALLWPEPADKSAPSTEEEDQKTMEEMVEEAMNTPTEIHQLESESVDEIQAGGDEVTSGIEDHLDEAQKKILEEIRLRRVRKGGGISRK